MKSIHAAVLALVGLCLGLASPADARTVHGIYGANGDAGDRDECAPGWYLVGVSVNTGAWWDKMAIACAPLQPDGKFGPAAVSGKAMGGPGGGPQPLITCHPSEFMSGVNINRTEGYQVVWIDYACTSAVTGAKRSVNSNGGSGGRASGEQDCLPGEAAKGFDVRFGRHVNGLGLICDTYTVPAPPPPPVAEAPPPCPFTQTRIDGVCACPPGQTFSDADGQCIIPPPPGAGGSLTISCKSGPGMSGAPQARGFVIAFKKPGDPMAGMPGPGECILQDRPMLDSEGTELTVPDVDNDNTRQLKLAANGGSFQLHVTPRADGFFVTSIDGVQVFDSTPLSTGPIDAVPAPGGGGGMTTSTCSLSGTATVVIANPALTVLNVRDEPDGKTILGTIPENTQVQVLGSCGVKFSAGIKALPEGGSGGKVIAGWCAVSTPAVSGCAKEEFLVAGIPAGGQAGLPPGSAGIFGPQTTPPPQAQPQAPAPVVTTPAPTGAGVQVARLTQGANIRNAASGDEKAKTGSSLPGGTVVTVLECVPSWCRIALPQFPVAWVSRGFLAFDVAAAPVGGPSVDVTINIGGGAPPVGTTPAPQPAPATGSGMTTSTCNLSGTATVVIPNPALTVLNVRDEPNGKTIFGTIPRGTQVEVLGPCGVKFSAGIQALPQGGSGGKVVAGWCSISTPQVSGCAKEEFLVAGIPAGGPVVIPNGAGIAGPQAVAEPSFTGTWSADAQGSAYTFNLNQDGNSVTGDYTGGDGSNGRLNGTVSGNVLRFSWTQTNDNLTGAGKFTLSGDGNSFTGSYTLTNDPDIAEGSWNGTRM